MEELKHLHMLTEQIGARGSTKSNEKLAAYYIKEKMENAGLQAQLQKFTSVKSFSWTFGFIYLIFLICFFIYLTSPLLAFFICFISLIIFKREANTKETISIFMPRGRSQNVIGKIAAKKYPVKKVILVAHYDSSKTAISFHPEMVKNFRLTFLLTYYSMFSVTLFFGISTILGAFEINLFNLFWYLSIPFMLILFSSFLILLHREIFGEYSPGANDNASGVSVLLELAKDAAASPLDFVETWFLAAGCKETGTVGMIRFLDNHKLDQENTYFINIDNIGTGNLKYIIEEGILKKYSSDTFLIKAASLAAQEKPELDVNGSPFHLLTTDAVAAMARGYKAITILAMDKNGLIPNWHWHTDTLEHIEKDNLVSARLLIKRILLKIEDSV